MEAHHAVQQHQEPHVCPKCRAQTLELRCPNDQSYTVTQKALDAAPGDTTLGSEIGGRYGITKRLGMGGMGAVYQGVDLKRGLTVAVKVLREAYAKHPAIRERFIREAEAGASLAHPNVVPLVDFGVEKSGRLWLAMEYAEGWTLRDEINNNGAFSVRSAIELTRQVLKGLAAAHDAGLIHRDLKHDNIMYFGSRKDFVARIVDFGVVKSEAADLMRAAPAASLSAVKSKSSEPQRTDSLGLLGKAIDLKADQDGAFDFSDESFDLEAALADAQAFADGAPASSRLTQEPPAPKEPEPKQGKEASAEESVQAELTAAGMMVGSPSYMAPEQIRGLKVGPPADLYALAVVVYEILMARRLFTVNDYETLLKEGAKRDAPRLVFSAKGEVIPEAFADMIHRALEHDPTDRYPDAHTMLLALDQLKLKESKLPANLLSRVPSFSLDKSGRPPRLEAPKPKEGEASSETGPSDEERIRALQEQVKQSQRQGEPQVEGGLGLLWWAPALVFLITLFSAYILD